MISVRAFLRIAAGWLAVGVAMGCAASEDGNTASQGSVGGATSAGGGVGRGGSSGSQTSSGGTGGGTSTSAPSWAQLWTSYFQPACVSCHANSQTVGSRRVFSNGAQMCTYMTSAGQLNGTATPAMISSTQSVLNWFSMRGSMPENNTAVPAGAVDDIKAWAAAGAVCP